MDGAEVLAERRLVMERDGVAGRQEIALQIGHPQWSKGGDDAVCAIAITGLAEDLPPVRGRDFFDVLVKAARTLRTYCKPPPQGIRFFYLGESIDDDSLYDPEPLDPDTFAAYEKEREAAHRKNWELLVERKILMQRDGSDDRHEVVLQIGRPYWISEGEEAACPIVLKGDGEDEIVHRHGRDPFEALSNAVRDINERFAGPQCGRFYFWPDGAPYGGDFPDIPRPLSKPDPREVSGNWQVLAERTLLMERDGDPKRRRITIKIGHPYWFEEDKEAHCPMEIVGLLSNMPAMRGSDFYMALIFALHFFNQTFMGPNSVDRFFWPDGTPYDGEPLDREPRPAT
jgi:hypothetical protein